VHFLSPDSYTSGHVACIQLYTCHHLEHPWLERHLLLFRLSTKLLMQEATQRITALERDLFCVASTGVFIHTFLVVSPAAIIFYFTYFTVHVRVICSPTSTSGQLGNDHLTTSSFASKSWNKLSWSFGDVILSAISDHVVAWVRIWRLQHKLGDRRFRYARDRGTPT